MKRVVILEHDGGELANQLWNYASILGYCFEKEYECDNWSFYEYAHYFTYQKPRHLLVRLFFFVFSNKGKRRAHLHMRAGRFLYKFLIVRPLRRLKRRSIITSRGGEGSLYNLPPTEDSQGELKRLEQTDKTIYFSYTSGGVFRNRLALEKYHSRLVTYFAPALSISRAAENFIQPLRAKYSHVVGVHLRQGDYKDFKGGKYWITQERAYQILVEYLEATGHNPSQTCFVITTDGTIDERIFDGLNIIVSHEVVGIDLFIQAACDAVIGSESTFGHFAAYMGNIPHIVMKQEPMDWEFYKGKTTFFWNKYLTIMHY